MKKAESNKIQPIRHYVKMLLLISLVTLILDIIISFVSISLVRQQSAQYLRDTADLYIDRINNNFSYLNQFMGWTLANDVDLEIMNDHDPHDAEFIKSHRNLYKRYGELRKSLGADYNFFIYMRNSQFFSNSAPMSISYPEFQTLKKQVIESVEDRMVYDQYYSEWTTIELDAGFYIIKIVPYHDSYMISLISAEKLIQPLREIRLGGEGYITLMDMNGESIVSPIPEDSRLLKLFQFGTTVNREFSNATFYVKLVIQFGAFEKIMIAQLLVVLLAVMIACYLSFIMRYFQKKVLMPIKNFSKNLAVITSDGEPIDFENSKIIELEKANKQFIDLVKQIKDIKIDLYERELEKQRVQLNYMKLQIKPHFFLNGLTSIYSMSQMKMYEEIQKMTLSISNYFRYIFQNNRDFVRLKDEIEHVKDYLEIQRQRYRNAFRYRIEMADSAADTLIPPLVLQTFIENAIKYAVSRDKEIEVVVEIERKHGEKGTWTYIGIWDTGPGFPQPVLEKLINAQPLDQSNGEHIGIMNTIQRLGYLYNQEAELRFANREDGGASIVMVLPDIERDDTE